MPETLRYTAEEMRRQADLESLAANPNCWPASDMLQQAAADLERLEYAREKVANELKQPGLHLAAFGAYKLALVWLTGRDEAAPGGRDGD